MIRRVEITGSHLRALSPLLMAALLAACSEPAAERPAEASSPPEPAAAGPAAAPEARIQAAPPVTPEGYGPVRIGMTEAEARQVLGERVTPAVGGPGDADACHFLTVGAQPPVLLYMVEGGKVTRVTIRQGSPARTDKGLGVGDTEAQVRAAYPDIEAQPHKYVDGGKDLFAWTEKNRRGVRYEVDPQGIVTQVHAGDQTIAYVEGCS